MAMNGKRINSFLYYIAATIANTASVASTVKAGIHSVMDGHSLTSGTNLFGRYFWYSQIMMPTTIVEYNMPPRRSPG